MGLAPLSPKAVNQRTHFSVNTISKFEKGSESCWSAEPVPPSRCLFGRNLFFDHFGVVLVPQSRASSP